MMNMYRDSSDIENKEDKMRSQLNNSYEITGRIMDGTRCAGYRVKRYDLDKEFYMDRNEVLDLARQDLIINARVGNNSTLHGTEGTKLDKLPAVNINRKEKRSEVSFNGFTLDFENYMTALKNNLGMQVIQIRKEKLKMDYLVYSPGGVLAIVHVEGTDKIFRIQTFGKFGCEYSVKYEFPIQYLGYDDLRMKMTELYKSMEYDCEKAEVMTKNNPGVANAVMKLNKQYHVKSKEWAYVYYFREEETKVLVARFDKFIEFKGGPEAGMLGIYSKDLFGKTKLMCKKASMDFGEVDLDANNAEKIVKGITSDKITFKDDRDALG